MDIIPIAKIIADLAGPVLKFLDSEDSEEESNSGFLSALGDEAKHMIEELFDDVEYVVECQEVIGIKEISENKYQAKAVLKFVDITIDAKREYVESLFSMHLEAIPLNDETPDDISDDRVEEIYDMLMKKIKNGKIPKRIVAKIAKANDEPTGILVQLANHNLKAMVDIKIEIIGDLAYVGVDGDLKFIF